MADCKENDVSIPSFYILFIVNEYIKKNILDLNEAKMYQLIIILFYMIFNMYECICGRNH